MKTYLYGGSDDLIEIEGAVSDEIGCYEQAEKGIKFSASDGTTGIIKYNGEWIIEVHDPGSLISKHIKSVGDELNHGGEYVKFTSYSDILEFDEGIEWIKIKGKTYRSNETN